MPDVIRCPNCGKTYAMKPELTGKQVRCGQCKNGFVVPAMAIVIEEDEPVMAVVAPIEATLVPRFDSLDKNPSAGAVADPFNQDFLTAGQTILAPVTTKRSAGLDSGFFKRLGERTRSTVVAIASLMSLIVILALIFRSNLHWGFLSVPLVGIALAALGLSLPEMKKRRRKGAWLDPLAGKLAGACVIVGLIPAAIFVLMFLAALTGNPIPAALGMSRDATQMMVTIIFAAIGIPFGAAILIVLVSIVTGVARTVGPLRLADILYPAASPVLLIVLLLFVFVSNRMRAPHSNPPALAGPSYQDFNNSTPPAFQPPPTYSQPPTPTYPQPRTYPQPPAATQPSITSESPDFPPMPQMPGGGGPGFNQGGTPFRVLCRTPDDMEAL